ncbi:hypothetical protein BS636_07600 [Acinetobacter sp. LoGeW2-3]|uniref:hypothetical protein n=1 Tax=Acinetobacter sp. LoGeW2-3 TaxID=1808001 RepID=UPI000C058599|nr:hypothetical protein [Acinetobacter sp. LoGeW2-3]ATO19536.1 hypothetical protein BS636_07600 [Acinetobacter sp. LoGeW2-3]
MKPKNISKYYYHEYVLITFLLLAISGLFAIFALDFTPTLQVKIGAFIVSTLIYLVILIYFYILYRQEEWVIPRTWKNAHNKPKFYFLFLLPLFAILILYPNIMFYPPLLHTMIFGQPTVVTINTTAVKKHGKKGSIYYSFKTPYDTSRIFRLNSIEYENYKNQFLHMKLSIIQGRFGTYIQNIESIQTLKTIQNK